MLSVWLHLHSSPPRRSSCWQLGVDENKMKTQTSLELVTLGDVPAWGAYVHTSGRRLTYHLIYEGTLQRHSYAGAWQKGFALWSSDINTKYGLEIAALSLYFWISLLVLSDPIYFPSFSTISFFLSLPPPPPISKSTSDFGLPWPFILPSTCLLLSFLFSEFSQSLLLASHLSNHSPPLFLLPFYLGFPHTLCSLSLSAAGCLLWGRSRDHGRIEMGDQSGVMTHGLGGPLWSSLLGMLGFSHQQR